MSDGPQPPPLKHVLATAREYLTHWFTAGVILTLTGFTPDHWVERLFHAVNLDGILESLPAVDYRLLAVGVGVAVSTCALVFRSRRGRKAQLVAAFVSTAAPAPGTAPVIEDLDDIAHKPSIAVLPFVNLSSDPEQEYFADGMTEDIITGLSCDSRLFVIARNSTFAYKGQSPDIRAVGKELGVRYVLEGSIRPIGDRLRITVQLIDTTSGVHVWADKIDRPAAELFAIMDDVVDGLVTTLCANLGVAESSRAQRARPEDLQAWALCVQAEVVFLSYMDSRTLLEAEKLARRAADIEPLYAVSWALLALMSCMRIVWGLSRDLPKDSEDTMSLVDKALRLAPNDSVVLTYCGWSVSWAGHAAQAIDYLERSLAINPNNSFSRLAYGAALYANARPRDGIAQLKLFIYRSPKDPYIGLVYVFLALSYLSIDDSLKAEQSARDTVKHSPGYAWGYLLLALSLARLGRDAEAVQHIEKVRQLEPGLTPEYVAGFWRHVNRPDEAEKLIALLRQVWRD